MSVSEQRRLEMHLGLRKSLGDTVADIVMEHLPQGGSSGLARTEDIEELARRIDAVDSRFVTIDDRMSSLERHIDILDGRMKLMVGGLLTVGLSLLAVLVQVLLEIAKL